MISWINFDYKTKRKYMFDLQNKNEVYLTVRVKEGSTYLCVMF